MDMYCACLKPTIQTVILKIGAIWTLTRYVYVIFDCMYMLERMLYLQVRTYVHQHPCAYVIFEFSTVACVPQSDDADESGGALFRTMPYSIGTWVTNTAFPVHCNFNADDKCTYWYMYVVHYERVYGPLSIMRECTGPLSIMRECTRPLSIMRECTGPLSILVHERVYGPLSIMRECTGPLSILVHERVYWTTKHSCTWESVLDH